MDGKDTKNWLVRTLIFSFVSMVLVGFFVGGFAGDPQKKNADVPTNQQTTPYLGELKSWNTVIDAVRGHPDTGTVGQITIFTVIGTPTKWVVNARINGGVVISAETTSQAAVDFLVALVNKQNEWLKEQHQKFFEKQKAARTNDTNPYTSIAFVQTGFNPDVRKFTDNTPLPVKIVTDAQPSMFEKLLETFLNMMMWLAVGGFVLWAIGKRAGGLSKINPNAKAMELTKSKAIEASATATLEDIDLDPNLKEEVQELIDSMEDPELLNRIGGRIPRNILFTGPPGTGKTLLARVIAGEAKVKKFYTLSGSELVEMFVGVGAARVRDMFAIAKANAPCIIFIDEIDALGRHRGAGMGGGNDEREQTLNQLLVEMDGFTPNDKVWLIAATNRADILDPALLRPGRFGDLTVTVGEPDARGRFRILKIHARDKMLTDEARQFLRTMAVRTPGFVGAQMQALLNQAARYRVKLINREKRTLRREAAQLRSDLEAQAASLKAKLEAESKTAEVIKTALVEARLSEELIGLTLHEAGLSDEAIKLRLPSELITVEDLVEGFWMVIGGLRSGRKITAEEMKNTAVHEIGHALVYEKEYQNGNSPKVMREVNCVIRQRALGVTMATPERDQVSYTNKALLAEILTGLAGRAAQKVCLGVIDSGASNDIENATKILREMTMRLGMDESLGPIHVGETGGQPFAGMRAGAPVTHYVGGEMQDKIDQRMQAMAKELMADDEEFFKPLKAEILAMAEELVSDLGWGRKEWLEHLRKYGFSEKLGWNLEYTEPDLDSVKDE